MADKLKAGVDWPAFEARVHGWAMDKPVIVVRLHGVSPESTKREIADVMAQYGEILDIDIGYISKKLLPGVTNGTWTIKMILDENKSLPSFVFMKEEGEVWQVIHENQVSVCWKCGKSGHVGARCNQPTLTFDALDGQAVDAGQGGHGGVVGTWAHVVKTGSGPPRPPVQSELEKQDELLRILKESERKEQDRVAAEKTPLTESLAPAADISKPGESAQLDLDLSIENKLVDELFVGEDGTVNRENEEISLVVKKTVDDTAVKASVESAASDVDRSVDNSVTQARRKSKYLKVQNTPKAADIQTSSDEENGDIDSFGSSKAGLNVSEASFTAVAGSCSGQNFISGQSQLKHMSPDISSGSSSDTSLHHKSPGGQVVDESESVQDMED